MLAEIPVEGKIIKEYSIGRTQIVFSDAACAEITVEDEHRILRQAAQASFNILLKEQKSK